MDSYDLLLNANGDPVAVLGSNSETLGLKSRRSVTRVPFGTAGISDVYLSPLTIVLEYGYLSSIYKNINILEEVIY